MGQGQRPDAPIEAGQVHELHQRDQNRLVGNEHAEEDQREQQARARETPLGQDVAVDRTDKGGDNRLPAPPA